MTSELLRCVRLLDPVSGADRRADVLITDGLIEAVEPQISQWSADTTVRDCQELILGPGLVDLYSHSGEPGFEERETIASVSLAAVAGGVTRLTILPDTVPPLDNPAGLARLRQQAARDRASLSPLPRLQFWGALTLGVEGAQMAELAELVEAGVVGFTDGYPLANLMLLRRALEYLRPLGKPVALRAGDRQLAGNGVMREGKQSIRFGVPGSPAIAESAALAALLEVVAATGTPVHLMRISTQRSVELIREAKARGLPIAASTTWMHVLLSTEDLGNYDPNLRLDPPLGNPDDQTALRQGLRDGTLDAIAIDHTPYTYEEKTVPFAEAPAGAIGLELALPLLWHNLVETGDWTALELWQCLSTNPARCLGQTPAAIAPGQLAELVLFDPQQTWKVERGTLNSLAANTPWLGQLLSGQVVQTWCPPENEGDRTPIPHNKM